MLRVGRLLLMGIGLAAAAASVFAADRPEPLIMGLHPNVSTRTILTMYQPVRMFLEKELGRPVELYTTRDFKTYVERTLQNEYQIAVAASHLARLAQLKGNYLPLLHYSDQVQGIIVTTKDAPIKSIKDLRGKTLALPDRLSNISLLGLEFLRDHGLRPDIDVKVFPARSHNNAALAVDRGQADAAVIGSVPYKQVAPELRARLRIVASTVAIPSQFIMASSKLDAGQVERIKSALLKFAETPQGKEFLQANGFGELRPPTQATLRALDRYANEVLKMLEQH